MNISRTKRAFKAAGWLILAFIAWRMLTAFMGAPSTPGRLASGCPQTAQGALSLPSDHADDLAAFLNAADALNHAGTCVLEGGWSSTKRMYYLTIQEPGASRPEIRLYHGADLRKLASLGQR